MSLPHVTISENPENWEPIKYNIKFSVNNWAPGETCPATANGVDLLKSPMYNKNIDTFPFEIDSYCRENCLCVYGSTVDMSFNYNVVASARWVQENWPEIIGSKYDCTDGKNKPIWEYDIWPEYKEENFKNHMFLFDEEIRKKYKLDELSK